jgi:hypothetical protein
MPSTLHRHATPRMHTLLYLLVLLLNLLLMLA